VTRKPQYILCAAIILFGLLYSFYFIQNIPLERDEGLAFRQTACAHNLYSKEFKDNCNGAFDLSILGIRELPLRAYYYLGFSQNFLFAPLYYLWPHYFSARILGVFFLFLLAMLIARWSGVAFWISFSLVAFSFPLLFFSLLDPGLAVQCFLLLLIPYLMMKVNGVWSAIGIGILFFISVEMRIFSLVFLPLQFFLFWKGNENRVIIKKNFLIISLAVFIGLLSLLLFSKTRGGEFYIQELLWVRSGILQPVNSIETAVSKLFSYVFSFSSFAGRMYETTKNIDIFTLFYWGICIVVFFIGRKKILVRWNLILLAAGILILFSIGIASEGHHLVLLLPFFYLALATALSQVKKKLIIGILITALVGTQIFIGMKTLRLPLTQENNESRMLVYQDLIKIAENKPNEYLFVIGDPGLFFSLLLYLPKEQAITWTKIKDENDIDYLRSQLTNLKRLPIFIFKKNGSVNEALLKASFIGMKEKYLEPLRWSMWEN